MSIGGKRTWRGDTENGLTEGESIKDLEVRMKRELELSWLPFTYPLSSSLASPFLFFFLSLQTSYFPGWACLPEFIVSGNCSDLTECLSCQFAHHHSICSLATPVPSEGLLVFGLVTPWGFGVCYSQICWFVLEKTRDQQCVVFAKAMAGNEGLGELVRYIRQKLHLLVVKEIKKKISSGCRHIVTTST